MSDLTWEEPTVTARRYAHIAAQLRAREGAWARVGDYAAYSAGTQARRAFGEGFEVRTAAVLVEGEPRIRVWARYVKP